MKTSLNEWTGLMDALDLNLNEASLTEFYHMARAILVKKESDVYKRQCFITSGLDDCMIGFVKKDGTDVF